MRIAQYYPWIYLKSGIERTILEFAKRSRHEHVLLTNHFDRENTYPEFRDLTVIDLPSVPVNRSLGSVVRAACTIASMRLDWSEFDAVLVHSDGLGDFLLCRNNQVPTVCFCHTPLRPVFDHAYLQRVLPRYSGWRRPVLHAFRFGFRTADQQLWRRYNYVFFNSAETVRRARSGGLLASVRDRFEILHPGLDVDRLTPSGIYEPYFLVPGRIMWTKNLELVLHAFLRFKQQSPAAADFKLVIAGHVDTKSEPYLAALRQTAGCHQDIQFEVSPNDTRLWELYQNCYAVVTPAFNEDWGMVPIEANAFAKAVLAIRRGGLLESQVDGVTGFLVEPDYSALSQALEQLAAHPDRTRQMGQAARQRVHRYDWSHFVKRLDDVLEDLCASRRSQRERPLHPSLAENR